MELNYFKDHLFDLINESSLLSIRDIITKDMEDMLIVFWRMGLLSRSFAKYTNENKSVCFLLCAGAESGILLKEHARERKT